MNKSESKYFNTSRLMNQALLKLLEEKEFEYITIKELCQKAGVNRSTFYLHYENMNDLLVESLDYILEKFYDHYNDEKFNLNIIKSLDNNALILIKPKYIIPYLEFIKAYKKLFLVATNNPALFDVCKTFEKMYKDIFSPILDKYNVLENEKKYILAFYLNGLHSIIIEWIKTDCKDSIDYICSLFIKYIIRK